jgi:hypothetical protein
MRYEASDQVFVAMPFTERFQQAYKTVIEPAIERVTVNGKKLQPKIVNRGTTGSPDIHEVIFDAIIHSRMVIADMTVQSMYTGDDGTRKWQANSNVAYEVGLACAWRNPEDILLIHQANREHAYSFDIQNLRHISYETANPDSSSRLMAGEIVRAINQSSFLAQQTYLKILQSISPSAIEFMHQESPWRAFPVISFPGNGMPVMDTRIHAITELLSYRALKNRNVVPQGDGKGVAVIYQWTELGLRLLLSIHAINQDRLKELSKQISEAPEDSIPPRELIAFPEPTVVPAESKKESD